MKKSKVKYYKERFIDFMGNRQHAEIYTVKQRCRISGRGCTNAKLITKIAIAPDLVSNVILLSLNLVDDISVNRKDYVLELSQSALIASRCNEIIAASIVMSTLTGSLTFYKTEEELFELCPNNFRYSGIYSGVKKVVNRSCYQSSPSALPIVEDIWKNCFDVKDPTVDRAQTSQSKYSLKKMEPNPNHADVNINAGEKKDQKQEDAKNNSYTDTDAEKGNCKWMNKFNARLLEEMLGNLTPEHVRNNPELMENFNKYAKELTNILFGAGNMKGNETDMGISVMPTGKFIYRMQKATELGLDKTLCTTEWQQLFLCSDEEFESIFNKRRTSN